MSDKLDITQTQAMAMIIASLNFTLENWDQFIKAADMVRGGGLLDDIPESMMHTDEEVRNNFSMLMRKLYNATAHDMLADMAMVLLDNKLTAYRESGKVK